MPKVLIPLAMGFEDLEAITVVDLLRRADIEVVTAGLVPGPITGSRGTMVIPDSALDAERGRDFDMIVLPGGLPGATNLEADPRIRELLHRHQAEGRFIAAICAAPKILAGAGVLDGHSATGYPGTLDAAAFPRVRVLEDPVVVDGKVVTSRGPGTAMDFALGLVELLAGAERRQRVEDALVRPA